MGKSYKNLPVSEINAQLLSFDFLDNEPDIYSVKDLKKCTQKAFGF